MKVLLCALADGLSAAVMQALPEVPKASFSAPNAFEAVRLLGGECPSVVVVGGGSNQAVASACRQLRAAESCQDAVIVALSSERPDDVHVLLEAGADDFLVEPLCEDALRSRLLVAHRAATRIERCRLTTTLDSIGDGVIATDLNGVVTRMNPVAEHLTGWALAHAKNRSFSEIFPLLNGDTRATIGSPVERALREGVVVSLPKQTMLARRDGTEIPIADSCAPIRASDGTVNGAVLVFRDLTAQRKTEVIEGHIQRQLVFADRMTAVGTLAAGVAHEINNPLTFVAANVDMSLEELRAIGRGSSSSRMNTMEEMLVDAREGVARVAKIVRGLKTFARLETERPSVIDLFPVIDLAVKMTFNEIRHHARLVKDYGPLPLVEADDARLGQVFINLLVNAAHAFPDGNTDANEIHVVTSTDPGGRAVVEVRDSGSGIPAAVLDRIFEPFFTTKAIGVGAGMGLAITYNIVTEMGGQIAVQSELGQGTSFQVVLPPSTSIRRLVPAVNDHSTSRPVALATVRVVDDEPA